MFNFGDTFMVNKIRYWAFEGNEGTGKTVLSKAFAEQCGAIWTYEPNAETEELRTLRELALDGSKTTTKYAREMCLLANRSIHHQVHVKPIIDCKETIITDRSVLSGMVYAKLETYSFDEWVDLVTRVHLTNTFPDVFVYCTSNKRKMNKNKEGRENDIYDNADSSIIDKIDAIYEDALEFLKKCKITKNIPIIRFENDFNKPVEDNLVRLMEILKTELK